MLNRVAGDFRPQQGFRQIKQVLVVQELKQPAAVHQTGAPEVKTKWFNLACCANAVTLLFMSRKMPPLLLGSASPRRRLLLRSLGVVFDVVAPDVREVHRTDRPRWTAMENARRKQAWCRERYPNHRILTADTVVAFRGRCIGKPANRAEAAAFLRLFSGNTHAVHTAVVFSKPGRACRAAVVTSRVTFRQLTDVDIREYLKRANPLDKAGAYDIAQHGSTLIACCAGSRSNVSGVPVESVRAWLGLARV